MRIFILLLHALQKLTICSRISLAICLLSIVIYLAPDFGAGTSSSVGTKLLLQQQQLAFTKQHLSDDERFPTTTTTAENVAKILEENVRILCICSALNPGDLCLEHPRETWGKRCTRWVNVYESGQYEAAYNVTVNETSNDLSISYTLEKPIYPYIYDQFRDDYDWYLRTTEVAFVVMENLRVFLGQFDATETHLFGYELTDDFVHNTAYVFSSGALERLVNEAMRPVDPDTASCINSEVIDRLLDEHLITGECFKSLQIYPEDSRDQLGRPRFVLLFNLWELTVRGLVANKTYIWSKSKRPVQEGIDQCCSESAIAFDAGGHHGFVLAFEYLLYRLHPIGVTVTHVLPQSETLLRYLNRKLPKKYNNTTGKIIRTEKQLSSSNSKTSTSSISAT